MRRSSVFPLLAAALLAATALLLAGPPAGAEQRRLRVVATLSTFADLAKQIGGDHVEVSRVASPRFNPHFIEPKPSDVLKVKKADLFVHAGLDLELWRDPLLEAAGNPLLFRGQKGELDLSQGLSLLEVPDKPVTRLMGDIHIYGNPHHWLDPQNARLMAQAVASKLSELDPAHAAGYRERLEAFLRRLDESVARWREKLAPARGEEAIAYHNEWPYLARFAGVKIERFLEPKPGIPPGPRELIELKNYIEARGIRVIIQPTFYPRGPAEALAKRTGAQVVILCQNVGEIPEASDYFAWMEYNVRQLAQSLGGEP